MDSPLKKTASWIQTFVIGHNLCPFAARPFQEERIRYVLVEGTKLEQLVETTFTECLLLNEKESTEIETTIIVHPKLLEDFGDYMDVLAQMQEDLEQLNVAGILQLATFHPAYQFEGTQADDPENFTNRSPFPMIHILREDSVEKAIDLHPDTAKIPMENIEKMNRIGKESLIKQRNEIIGTP